MAGGDLDLLMVGHHCKARSKQIEAETRGIAMTTEHKRHSV
jgi:hypothetical protein